MFRSYNRQSKDFLHTEFVRSRMHHPHPDARGESSHFGPLVRVVETLLQPEGEVSSGPFPQIQSLVYLREGVLRYYDGSGGHRELRPNSVLVTSVLQEEAFHLSNPSASEIAHFLEIEVDVGEMGERSFLESQDFEQKAFRGTLLPVASGQGHSGSLVLSQDAAAYMSLLYPPEKLIFETLPTRRVFLLLITGGARLEDQWLKAGDSAKITREGSVSISPTERSQLLLIDLP